MYWPMKCICGHEWYATELFNDGHSVTLDVTICSVCGSLARNDETIDNSLNKDGTKYYNFGVDIINQY